jgi:hypothetical protein
MTSRTGRRKKPTSYAPAVMGVILLALFGVLLGLRLGRSWALAVPLAIGLTMAFGLSFAGDDLSDTPVVFLVVLTTAAIGAGIAVRRVRGARAS